jgi:oligoribonuclease NrnB/cAMP/cGMP phosphodiesterase (DHH superfamily)
MLNMNTFQNLKLGPNRPDIVSEKFEDEYILVSLINGNYYSLRGTASDLWDHVEDTCNMQSLVSAYRDHYDLNQENMRSLEDFLKDLISQGLAKTVPDEDSIASVLEIQNGGDFEIPVVEAYSDMQDLLLLDPIHDVDEETGWPTQPDAEESK